MPTVLLCVTGMRGPEDEARVRRALLDEPGVYGAVASHEDACAEVDVDDDEVTVARLLEVIEAAGYRAVLGG